MILDVRPLLRGETDHLAFSYQLTPEPMDGVTFDADAHVEGTLTDTAGYMRLTLSATVGYTGACARCLDEVRGTFSMQFDRTVTVEGAAQPSEEEDGVYDDEYLVIEDGKLEIDPEIREELLLKFPSRLLCSDTCPGLCPKCGKPKRLGDCGCRTHEPDPRWAVLGTLLTREGEPESDKK